MVAENIIKNLQITNLLKKMKDLKYTQEDLNLAVAEERKRIENNIERYGFYDKYRNMNVEIAQNQSTINLITNK